MQFRKAVPGEEKNVFFFYRDIIDRRTDQDYKLWWNLDVYPTQEDFNTAVKTGTMYLALEDEQIIGAAMLNDNQVDGYDVTEWKCNPKADQIAVIHLVAVDPAQRGKGLGRSLMEYLIATARSQGIRSLRLDTMPHYSSAIRLYENMGFQKRNEVELTYPTTGKQTFCMYELVL